MKGTVAARAELVERIAEVDAIVYCAKHLLQDLYMSVSYVQVPVPEDMKATVAARRAELVERIAEVDETVGELFLMEEPIDDDTLKAGIRRATVALKFVPVFMGRSALARLV